MYGCLNDIQKEALKPFLHGRAVTDLGCGDGGWAKYILEEGATRVVAVDKDDFIRKPHWWRGRPVQLVRQHFADFKNAVDVAFVSWPVNSYNAAIGLIGIIDRADTVIYLGSNVEGNNCGSPQFFENLLHRELLAYEPDRRSTLIVYGKKLPVDQKRLPQYEEMAGMYMFDVYAFDGIRM